MDVRLASGQVVTDIPEGMPPEELLAQLSRRGVDVSKDYASLPKPKQQIVSGPESFRQAAREEAATRSAPARYMQGAGETFDRYAYGLKGLFTDLGPEEKQRLQENKIMAEEGGIPAMAGQVSGDLAITAPVVAATGAALPLASRAVAPAASRVFPQWAQRAAQNPMVRDLTGVAGSVAGGAATGAVSAPEHRLEGAAWGAGGNLVGGLPRAVRAVAGRTGAAGAAGSAAADIAQGTGRTAGDVAHELANRIEQGAAEAQRFQIPVTASQAARSPELAAKEIGVRAALPEEFAHHARQQNEAIYEAMRRATAGADNLAQLESARDAITKPMRDRALQMAESWPRIADPVIEHIRAIRNGATGANPDVERILQLVEREVNRPGGTTAARLYELEKYLRKKLTGPHQIGDEVGAAVAGAEREVNQLRDAIHGAIDVASGGQWQPYRDAYAAASRVVDDAIASRGLREAANAPGKALVGDAPHTTARTLGIDVARAGEGKFGTLFAPPTARELDDLVQFVRRIEEPMRTLKLASTGGGGSQTPMQLMQVLSNVAGFIPGGSVVQAPIMSMIGAMRNAEKEQLARLLLDPAAAVEALRRSAIAGAPLSRPEEIFRQIARAGSRTAGQIEIP